MRSLAILCVCLVAWGCGDDKDRRPPPAPTLHPVTSPTSSPTQVVSGSAEPGSTVHIAGGQKAIDVTADRFSAAFFAEVALNTEGGDSEEGATTELVVTAIDKAGNESEPATASIVYRAPRADRLTLRLTHDVISADDGMLTARARIDNPQLLDLSGFEVEFSVQGVMGVASMVGTTDETGTAEVTFSGLSKATEVATVTASAVTNHKASDSQAFRIVAGAPDALAFELTNVKSATIEAGSDVSYTYAVSDAHGNRSSAPVIVSIDHPGAQVLDDHVSGQGTIVDLTRASSTPYTITANVSGSKLSKSSELTVTAAAGARTIAVTLSVSSMAVDDTVAAFAIVRDRFGNVIDSPAPDFSLVRSDGTSASGAFSMPSASEFTISEPDIYRVRGSFDDGENPVASADAYVVVQATPDARAPSVKILSVNGYGICADGTLQTAVPADCANPAPAVTFQRGTVVVVQVQVDDDRALAEASFKAFGSGVSAGDFTLLGAGSHTPGTPIKLSFVFRINNTAIPGDAWVVAQAKDAAGNTTNSTLASLRIDLGISALGGRTLAPIVVDNALAFTSPRDVVAFGSTIYVTNRDGGAPVIYRIDGQTISTWATLPDRPELMSVDAAGNLFVSVDGVDEIWKISAGGAASVYQDQNSPNPPNNPEGLASLDASTPSTGRFRFAGGGSVQDQNCVEIAGQVYEFDTGGGTMCQGAAGNCGQAFDVCVAYSGSLSDARAKLTAAINANSTTLAAFDATSCDTGNFSCVFMVAKSVGAGISEALNVLDGGSISAFDVQGGQDASLLYAADRGSQLVYEFQAPNAPDSSPLATYDLAAQLRSVAASLRGSASTPWLQLLAVDDGNDQLLLHDVATAHTRVVADQNDGLNNPFDVLWSANGCAIVANQGSGEILAIGNVDGPGANTTELIADGFSDLRGIAWEGTGQSANLLVVDSGFTVVLRITPTASTTDCF